MVTRLMVLRSLRDGTFNQLMANGPPAEVPSGDCIMTDRGWKPLFQLDCHGSTQRVTYPKDPNVDQFHVDEVFIDMPTPDTFRQEVLRRLASSTLDYNQIFIDEQRFRRK